ncbi:spore germination protein KA [Tumebacillus sp. BK434]|uniref:spore germination protein n=1 Tax=Tumebacillus sp. BK434 TaxID=2512169 RepID=UPI0010476708|nr:spore germination protein [Tumebacillus sp. BK434]TCP53406.1 spore germination protein KA [Tumebacillus sp. BK434]
MSGWQKLKKYILADSSAKQNSFSLGHWEGEQTQQQPEQRSLPTTESLIEDYGDLSAQLDTNLHWFKRHFSYPQSSGLIIRPLTIGQTAVRGAAIYLTNQIKEGHFERAVLQPLMTMQFASDEQPNAEKIINEVITDAQVATDSKFGQIVHGILTGSAAVLIDGMSTAILADVKGWEKRGISKPNTELVVRGSNEGFTDDIQTNLSMIRRRIRTPGLMVERGIVGSISRTEVAVVYIKTIANDELVAEVHKRIAAIKFDFIGDSGTIEQWIEDRPNSIYPSILSTERPDRVAAHISEGYVCILVDNSPFGLIVPGHFPLFLQTAEDSYLRWTYSSFLRIVRLAGFFLALYLPALYVAIANFHQEMIPTTLLLAIAETREAVPIPVAAETFMLESMFELIREAGVRIPSVIGPTIGIVGALILGQAAVQANIVSPIVVIITATTALASYTIPNYNMQFATRILRFAYLLAGSFLGLLGIVSLSLMLWMMRASENTFGVPGLSPIAPFRKSKDRTLRSPIRSQNERQQAIRPKLSRKIPKEKKK